MNRLRSAAQKTFCVIRNFVKLCHLKKQKRITNADALLSANSLAIKYHYLDDYLLSHCASSESIPITTSSCYTINSAIQFEVALSEEAETNLVYKLTEDSLCLDQLFQEARLAFRWDRLPSISEMFAVRPLNDPTTISNSAIISEEMSSLHGTTRIGGMVCRSCFAPKVPTLSKKFLVTILRKMRCYRKANFL